MIGDTRSYKSARLDGIFAEAPPMCGTFRHAVPPSTIGGVGHGVNFVGQRILALGGAQGKWDGSAPEVARTRYKLDIVPIEYKELAGRLEGIMADAKLQEQFAVWTDRYLAMPNTKLNQQDVEILGHWKRLIPEARDSHWMMVYGDYLREVGYAIRKIGMTWDNVSDTDG